MRKASIIATAAAIAVAVALVALPTTPVPIPSPEEMNAASVEVVASNLEVPWALAIADDGRIFFTERPGRIKVIENGNVTELLNLQDRVTSTGESGLLGLALDPDFGNNATIYVYYTYADETGAMGNRVSKFLPSASGYSEQILLNRIPAAEIHDGGRVKFGPDGKLYITTGDAAQPSLSQDLSSLAGKILRINPDGSIPDDNPFQDSPVYSYGHRNPQGIAWHPVTKQLYETEHGPTGNDEVNIVRAGGNYGWPEEQCTGPEEYIDSIACYPVSVAPSGATFYSPGNDLFFATLRGTHLERVILDEDGMVADRLNVLEDLGRLRDVVQGPDGYLYISTSNRDGRGIPTDGDDKILRLTLAR